MFHLFAGYHRVDGAECRLHDAASSTENKSRAASFAKWIVKRCIRKLGKIDSTGTDQGSQFLNRDGNIHILVAAVLHFRTGTLKFLCRTRHNGNTADLTRIDALALRKPGFNQRAEHLLRRFRRR